MRLPRFEYLRPDTMDEALEMLHRHQGNSRILSGGTDLLVRMKQRHLQPDYLISLKSIRAHRDVRRTDGFIEIGACASLDSTCTADPVKKHLPGLVKAIESIGAPSIQHHAGTIGGNLCQENRCLYYNQSSFLRSARQTCHKAGGQICYALEGSDRCRSTFQSDCAPILIALNAKVTIVRQSGQRTIPLVDLYSAKGEAPLTLEPDELVITIEVPIPESKSGHAYHRLAFRTAIEFPMVAVGASAGIADGKIKDVRVVVGAVSTAPLLMAKASASLIGKAANDHTALDKAADMVQEAASAFVVNNVNAPIEYRQKMIGVLVRRALGEALKQAVQ